MIVSRLVARVLAIFITALPLLSAPAKGAGDNASAAGTASPPASASAALPCEKMGEALLKASPADRIALAGDAIQRPCHPVPLPLWNAIRFGKWNDKDILRGEDRVALLVLMVGQKDAEAESLAVSLLEGGGRWPEEGSDFSKSQAIQVITSLKPVLTPYRIRLLLDIYEQLTNSSVRVAILKTLQGSKDDEAMLPIVSACWDDSAAVKKAGLESVAMEKEKTPEGVLARIILDLPAGAVLDSAEKLGVAHPSSAVNAALKKRRAR